MADFGYDVADYCDVDPLFGTLADLDGSWRLPRARHPRRARLGPEPHARTGTRGSRRRAPRARTRSATGTCGATAPRRRAAERLGVDRSRRSGRRGRFDERTGQWYLHSFMAEQPDLNWDNPEVEAAMHDVLRFWLERGIDGFRLDAIVRIAKDPLLRSNGAGALRHDENWDSIHDRLRGIRRVVDEYPDRMIVGEVDACGPARARVVPQRAATSCTWRTTSCSPTCRGARRRSRRRSRTSRRSPSRSRGRRGSSPTTTCRAWRAGSTRGGQGAARARALLLMLYALRGTPFIYQGEELGLPDAVIPPERVVDVDGRDPERAPIPWRPPSEAGPGAGFTDGEPWLPLVDGRRVAERRAPGRGPALDALADAAAGGAPGGRARAPGRRPAPVRPRPHGARVDPRRHVPRGGQLRDRAGRGGAPGRRRARALDRPGAGRGRGAGDAAAREGVLLRLPS